MADAEFTLESCLSHPAERVFAWHARAGALERLIPPWTSIRVVARDAGLADGVRVTLEVPVGPLRRRWVAEHRGLIPGREFSDVQVEGPFASWEHRHLMVPDGPNASRLVDTIRYALPLPPLGSLVGGRFARAELVRTFAYRHRTTRLDLDAHAGCSGDAAAAVAVTGASGLVGSALVPFLRAGGHRVLELGRSRSSRADGELRWDPEHAELDTRALEGVDAVVHLAGQNIAAGRWTRARKRQILSSRVEGTRFLAERLASMSTPPRVLISASAVGFYGDTADRETTEASAPGSDFLADVCARWEAATEPAEKAGIRVVHLRLGVVLTPRGGALARMLVPFRMGVGGVVGSGEQFVSWIDLEDLVRAIHHVIVDDALEGPVNAVAPRAVSNRELTRTLGAVLHRPTTMPVPAPVLRAALGEMGQALLLTSTRVVPAKLTASKFVFAASELETALSWSLGRPGPRDVAG